MPEQLKPLLDALFWARVIAAQDGALEIRPQNLLLGLFRGALAENSMEEPIWKLLGLRASVYDELHARLRGSAELKSIEHGDFPLAGNSQSVIREASNIAQSRADSQIPPLYVLLAFLSDPSLLNDALVRVGITKDLVEHALPKA
jgi:hypothetical protein